MSSNRVYFPNLNGVRFLAALVVIINHIEMGKYIFGQPNAYSDSFVGGIFGQLGIILFFALSGFLITYLLLEEHRQSGTISIKNFYIRRLLRIWPVYYLIIILGLFILPQFTFFDLPGYTEELNDGFFLKSLTYLTFLPNVGYTIYEHIPYASQTWSVGVEEQFYLLWPVLMLFAVKRKWVLRVLIATILFYLAVKTITVYNYIQYPADITTEKIWLFWDHFSIDAMAIGGIGAYLLFYKKEKILNILFNKYLQIALYAIMAIVVVKGWVLPWYNKEWYAIVFTVLLLNLAANKKSVLNLEYKPLNYLGKISYGLYMYHNLVLTVVLKLIMKYELFDVGSIAGGIFFQVIAIGLTIAVSALSYHYFEKWFLTVKTRFAKVQSGEKMPVPETVPTPEKQPAIPLRVRPQTA